mgnify:CR=1 FL=1
MTSNTDFNVVSATSIQGVVTISKPAISYAQVKDLIDAWIAKQDQFWPKDLTGEVLVKNVNVLYAAHWILSGEASGTWSASIGVDRTEYIPCNNCSGRGRYRAADMFGDMKDFPCPKCDARGVQERTRLEWHSQSGVARGRVGQVIVENVASNTEIRCGKRDKKASEYKLDPNNSISVFVPEGIDQTIGLAKAKDMVVSSLNSDANNAASGLGRVQDLRLGRVDIERLDARTWLYPIYAGRYEYDGNSHLIEVDGITGKMHLEEPKSVSSQRTEYRLEIVKHWLKIALYVAIPIITTVIIYNILMQNGLIPNFFNN